MAPFTVIPAWISNYTYQNVWDEIIYPFPNFNGVTVEVWEWISNFIPHFIMDVIIYPCQDLSESMLVKGDPGITMSSSVILSTIYDKLFLVFHKEGFSPNCTPFLRYMKVYFYVCFKQFSRIRIKISMLSLQKMKWRIISDIHLYISDMSSFLICPHVSSSMIYQTICYY